MRSCNSEMGPRRARNHGMKKFRYNKSDGEDKGKMVLPSLFQAMFKPYSFANYEDLHCSQRLQLKLSTDSLKSNVCW